MLLASAFIGVGGPYRTDSNHDGRLDSTDPINPNAKGFVVDDLNFGVVIAERDTLEVNPVVVNASFFAVKATANNVGVVGFGDDFKLEVHNVKLNINQGSGGSIPLNNPVIDFASSFPADSATNTPAQSGAGRTRR